MYPLGVDAIRLSSFLLRTCRLNRECVIRSLVSNAEDALVVLRNQAEMNDAKLAAFGPSIIDIYSSKKDGTLVIEDNGIGMTKEELTLNLGSLGKAPSCMMGVMGVEYALQFEPSGVGLYSAFLLADKLRVVSKALGTDEQYVWETSVGRSTFALQKDTEMIDGELKRGAKVILYLRETQSAFLETRQLRRIVGTESLHLGYPIRLFYEATGTELLRTTCTGLSRDLCRWYVRDLAFCDTILYFLRFLKDQSG